MFGYVKIYAPELLVREHEYYKGTYCGLCHAMGRCTGQCSRLTLSYDVTFLSLIRLALAGEKTSFSQKRCVAHPLKKRNVMNGCAELDYCSYASALLTYHKLADDIRDENFLRRNALRIFALPSVSLTRRRALRRASLDALDARCEELLCRLSELESQHIPSVDEPAQLFGELLAEIFTCGLEGSRERIAREAGLHIGRWIYIVDALDDMPEDKEKGNYNPFLLLYGDKTPTEQQYDDISSALNLELMGAERALDLIDYGEDKTLKNIIFNVLYLGMPKRVEDIINKATDKNLHSQNKKL